LRAAQVQMQAASSPQVAPDVPADRFVADRQLAVPPQIAGDLLGTPFLPQQRLHSRPRQSRIVRTCRLVGGSLHTRQFASWLRGHLHRQKVHLLDV
jgi:hypothetical protein